MRKISLIALVCLLCCALPALAQVNGDFRSVASGNWDALTTWETFDGATWAAATAKPGAANNVYLQAGFIVTLQGNEECLNLNLHNATTDSIIVGPHTLSVNGSMAEFSTGVGVFPVTYSTTTNNKINTAGGGKISIVGNSRTVFNTGQWSANPQYWNLEIAMNYLQECYAATNLKAGRITVSSGTLTMGATGLRPDSGAANTGNLTVKAGAALHFTKGNTAIQRIGTAGAASQFGTFMIEPNGTVQFDSSGTVIGAGTLNLAGTVYYQGPGNQTMATKGANSAAADPNTYTILRLSGVGIKTLGLNTTVNGQLWLSGYATLAVGAYMLTYGPNARLYYNGVDNLAIGDEWPAINYPADVAIYMADSSKSAYISGFNPNHNYKLSRQLFLLRGILNMNGDTVSILGDSTVYRSGTYRDAYVRGNLAMHVAAGTVTKEYPLGDIYNYYKPITVSFNSVSTPGMLTAVEYQGAYEPHVSIPASTLPLYWNIAGDGALTFDQYNATFAYYGGDAFGDSEATMVGGKYEGTWSFPTVGARDTAANTIELTGMTSFSNFAIGKDSAAISAPVSDTTRPYITGVSPTMGATGVALDAPIVIAFSEPMDTNSFDGIVTPDITVPMAWNATRDTLTLDWDSLYHYSTTYTLVFTAGKDIAGNDLTPLPDTAFQFTTIANERPVIILVQQPADTYDGIGPFIIRAVITDPAKAGIVADTLWYTDDKTNWWFQVHSSLAADTFGYSIPGPFAPGTIIEYFVGAWDDAGALSYTANQFKGDQFRILDPLAPTNLTATAGNNQVQLNWVPPVEELQYDDGTPAWAWSWFTGNIFTTRFTPQHYPCKIIAASSLWSNNYGIDTIELHVWPDNGFGIPDTTVNLVPPCRVLPASMIWLTLDLSSYNVILASGDFHVGYVCRTDAKPNAVSDAGGPGLRSLIYNGSDYGNLWNGIDYFDLLSRAVVQYSSFTKGLALKSYTPKTGDRALPKLANLKAVPLADQRVAADPKPCGALGMVKNIGGYSVFRGDLSGGPYSVIGTATTPDYLDNTAVNGTPYYYVVRATYSTPDTFSGWSNEISSTPSGVEGGVSAQRYTFSLAAVRPNPVHGAATFQFTLPAVSGTRLDVYNIMGQRVRTLVNGMLAAGPHAVRWQGNDDSGRRAASGVYIYKLTAENNTATQRLTLIR